MDVSNPVFKITIPVEIIVYYPRRKRLTIPKCSTRRKQFIEDITEWNRRCTPSNLENYYEDLINILEELLNDKQCSRQRHIKHSNRTKYADDVRIRKWNRLMRVAHKK